MDCLLSGLWSVSTLFIAAELAVLPMTLLRTLLVRLNLRALARIELEYTRLSKNVKLPVGAIGVIESTLCKVQDLRPECMSGTEYHEACLEGATGLREASESICAHACWIHFWWWLFLWIISCWDEAFIHPRTRVARLAAARMF